MLQSSATNPTEWLASFTRPSRFKWWARIAYPFIRFKMEDALADEDNEARVRQSTAPLLVIVRADEDITPPRLSETLFNASAAPVAVKWLSKMPGRGHEDVIRSEMFPSVYATFVSAAILHRTR